MCAQNYRASNKLRWFFVSFYRSTSLSTTTTLQKHLSAQSSHLAVPCSHKCCSFLPFVCSLLSFTIMMGVDRHVFSFNYTQSDTRIVWGPTTTGCMPQYSSLSWVFMCGDDMLPEMKFRWKGSWSWRFCEKWFRSLVYDRGIMFHIATLRALSNPTPRTYCLESGRLRRKWVLEAVFTSFDDENVAKANNKKNYLRMKHKITPP